MTAEAALTKLHFLLSQDLPAPRIRELMQQSLRGELTPDFPSPQPSPSGRGIDRGGEVCHEDRRQVAR